MAGPSIGTWVKVRGKSGGTTPRVLAKKYGGGAYEQGQVITQSEYNAYKERRADAKATSTTKPSTRVKSADQRAMQEDRIVGKVRQRIDSLQDKMSAASEKAQELQAQANEGRKKVATRRKRKTSREYGDAIAQEKAFQIEAAAIKSGRDITFTKRRKKTSKQLASINDQINQQYGKMAGYQDRIDQLRRTAQGIYSRR
jgi:hypothetical protein